MKNTETIFFKAQDGVILNGIMYKNTNKTAKIRISVHGMATNCIKKRDEIIAQKANEINIDFLAFNNRGHDLVNYIKKESKEKPELAGTAYEEIAESYEDIVGAINYAIEQGYKEIYIIGHSLGCTKTIYTYNKLIEENEKGTHILSTKDLCLVKHLKDMIDAGIDSFKVEGRTKSLYYVSAVAKAYREAIDTVLKNPNADMQPYYDELLKVGNRGYTTGFYLGEGYPKDGYSYDISKGLAGADFLCEFWGREGDYYKIKTKNKFNKNEDIEVISPEEKFVTQVTEIKNMKGEELELANTNDELLVKLTNAPKDAEFALARTVGIKRV